MSSPALHGRHLGALTGIRGIAAWLVVFYHMRLSLQALLPEWTIAALAKGYLAVDLFFILSGFVLWYNYGEKLRSGGWQAAGPFLWRRIARIWPLHLAILAAFALFVLMLALTGRSTTGYPLAELPLHVLLIQNWGFTRELSWNHPAWSISTELAAYLCFPMVVHALRWERLPLPMLLAIAAGLLGAIHLLFALNGETTLGGNIPALGLWRCLLEFTLGNIACLLWRQTSHKRHAGLLAALACTGFLCGGAALALPETAFVPAVFLCGILFLALDGGIVARTLGHGPLHYLGEISYSTYLAHFLLFILFKILFVDASLQMGWTALAGFTALLLAASVLLHHGLEKPAQAWLTRHPPHRLPPFRKALPAE